MDNFPCKCGHTKEVHFYNNGACSVISLPFTREKRKICECSGYVSDNLKYLEMKYKEKLK